MSSIFLPQRCPTGPSTLPLYAAMVAGEMLSDEIPLWRRRDPTRTPEAHWDWLLRHIKGESPQQIADRDCVSAPSVCKALQRLGVRFERRGKYPDAIPVQARRAFSTQRSSAARRGIAWDLTLEQWWAIWSASGKWPQRGKDLDSYVMARRGDAGPYALGNVRIATARENMAEAQQVRRLRAAA